MRPTLLRPGLQHYAWGDSTTIPSILGLPPTSRPHAEAWFGAHPACPATLDGNGPLDAAIAADPVGLLGEQVAARFGGLPYLLKILAAARPLSIQVHPSQAQAAEGFRREDEAGIPRDAAQRSYRDASHKPELLVALTPFFALAGFRAPDDLARLAARWAELGALVDPAAPLAEAVRAHLERPAAETAALLGRLHGRLTAEAPFADDDPAHWFLDAAREHPGDPGLLFVFLLELVALAPGEGIFLEPGVPHAYLRGAGVELMASSDNVLRCGLTPKHVDVPELLRIVDFGARRPEILRGSYPTPAEELCLSRIELRAPLEATAEGPETILNTGAAAVQLEHDGGALGIGRGGACFVPAGTRYRLVAAAPTTVFRAGVPLRPTFRGREPTRLAFGTSGLRGLVDDITDLEAYVNTRGFLSCMLESGRARRGDVVPLGGDLRPSSERILAAVARAVVDAGLRVEYCGRLPTPALTLHGISEGRPSIMVTGSHIPFDRNGIKFNRPDGEVLKEDEAPILAAVERARRAAYAVPASRSPFADDGSFRPGERPALPAESAAARERYLRRTLDAFPPGALSGLRLAFYQHSAVGRDLIPEILGALGAGVVTVGRTTGFVALDTEAISDALLAEIAALAAPLGPIDALLSTDGDSDRPLLLIPDERGDLRFVGGDQLGLLVAELVGADAVAVPVSSTDAIERHLAARGVQIARTRIGSPHVIAAMARLSGSRRVGWEANGGFLVDALPTRDAVLPLVTVLAAAARERVPVRALVDRLPRRCARAALLDAVPVEQSRALMARLTPPGAPVDADLAELPALRALLARVFSPARGFGAPRRVSFLDGVRVSFDGGDIAHIRPSGNAPQLRIYAVADSDARAREICALGVAEPDGILRELLSRD